MKQQTSRMNHLKHLPVPLFLLEDHESCGAGNAIDVAVLLSQISKNTLLYKMF